MLERPGVVRCLIRPRAVAPREKRSSDGLHCLGIHHFSKKGSHTRDPPHLRHTKSPHEKRQMHARRRCTSPEGPLSTGRVQTAQPSQAPTTSTSYATDKARTPRTFSYFFRVPSPHFHNSIFHCDVFTVGGLCRRRLSEMTAFMRHLSTP